MEAGRATEMESVDSFREETKKAEAALPSILEALIQKREAVDISRFVSKDFEVSETTAFEWVRVIEEQFFRRRTAVMANALLGPGLAIGIISVILGANGPGIWFVIAGAGFVVSAISALILLRLPGIAARKVTRAQS